MLSVLSAIDWEIKKEEYIKDRINRYHIKPETFKFSAIIKGNHKYYRVDVTEDGIRRRKYVGTEKDHRFRSKYIASFNKAALEIVDKNLDLLNDFKNKFVEVSAENIKAQLSKCTQGINAYTSFDKDMEGLVKWASEDYTRNSMPFNSRAIYAKDGSRVRSKSECIIYNESHNQNMPFRYDSVISLDTPDGGKKLESPDFLYPCIDNSLIILEHAGLLANEEYLRNFLKKIQLYHYNNFDLGVNLFITSDQYDGGIDTEAIEQILEMIKWRMFRMPK